MRGTNPTRDVPVLSVRFLPTTPLALASPFGKCDDVEFSRSRADSQALAATTTTRARTCASAPVVLSMYPTPVARPLSSTVISRAIALATNDRRPVRSAGSMSTPGLAKLELVLQPRLH